LDEKETPPVLNIIETSTGCSPAPSSNFDELRQLIYLELGDRLTNIAPGLSLDDGAFQVIQWAHTRGNTRESCRPQEGAANHKLVQALAGPRPPASPLHRHLPKVDPYLTGRSRELAFLDTAWTSGANVVQIVASGGTGKTALMDHWFRRHRTEATVFGWSFYSQGPAKSAARPRRDPFFAKSSAG